MKNYDRWRDLSPEEKEEEIKIGEEYSNSAVRAKEILDANVAENWNYKFFELISSVYFFDYANRKNRGKGDFAEPGHYVEWRAEKLLQIASALGMEVSSPEFNIVLQIINFLVSENPYKTGFLHSSQNPNGYGMHVMPRTREMLRQERVKKEIKELRTNKPGNM